MCDIVITNEQLSLQQNIYSMLLGVSDHNLMHLLDPLADHLLASLNNR